MSRTIIRRCLPLLACLLVASPLAACAGADDATQPPEQEASAPPAQGEGATQDPALLPTAPPSATQSATPDPNLPGFPYALAFDPSDPTRAYFTWRGGLLASTDGGATWQALPQSKTPGDTEVHHVVVDGTGTIFLGGPGNFRFSDDGGTIWQDVPGAGTADVRGLVFNSEDQLLLLDGESGVMTAQADGTWQSIGSPPGRAYGLWPIDQDRLASLDLESDTVSVSSDGGRTWEALPDAPPGKLHGLASNGADLLYAATNTGLQRSEDAGATWQSVGPFTAVIGVASPPGAPDSAIVVIPGGNVYRSDDRGETWPGSPEE
jgi:photosystem II stability/assembly factor-like uncharacterized protein